MITVSLHSVFFPFAPSKALKSDVLAIPVICLVVLSISNFVIRHRIRKGYFLSNEAEARETLKLCRRC